MVRVPAIVAAFGLVIVLGGVFQATRTVETPLQDCGVAAAFLIDGRMNVVADPSNPPDGHTSADVRSNNDKPCQERAANQARPGAVAIVVGLFVISVAALSEVVFRRRLRRRRLAVAAAVPASTKMGG